MLFKSQTFCYNTIVTRNGVWRSLVARSAAGAERVAGSNPVTPIHAKCWISLIYRVLALFLYDNASFFEDNYYWRRVLTFSLPNGSSYTVGLNFVSYFRTNYG